MRFIHTFNAASFADSTVSLLSAFVFGVLIGAERQYRQRTAGMRTNALVALGGAAFVDLAQRLAGDVESLRVIAYVVSGIGFLGAGAIIKEGANVRGMNTAATLWCSAAVGACCGSDMVAEGVLLTFFVIAGNTLLRPLVQAVDRMPGRDDIMEAAHILTLRVEASRVYAVLAEVETSLTGLGYTASRLSFTNATDQEAEVTISLLPGEQDLLPLKDLVGKLSADSRIRAAHWQMTNDA